VWRGRPRPRGLWNGSFSFAAMTRAELIQSNAAKLRDLHDAIHSTVKSRHEGDSQRKRWEDACRKFHESYDQLAFPGGLTEWLGKLKANDPAAIEDAVLFLEVDPFFFRSGYIKESAFERLRWADLDEGHKLRLQQVILARIRDARPKREFRRYCILAPFVADPAFREEVTKIAGSSGAKPKRAQWVMEHIKQGIPKKKKS
jgi:hypothetical protein